MIRFLFNRFVSIHFLSIGSCTEKLRRFTFDYRLKYCIVLIFLSRFLLREDSKMYTMQCWYLLLASGSKIAMDFAFEISILQFFPTFLHLIHFVIPWGSSLTDSIPVRPLSGHSFNLWLFWSLDVAVAVVYMLFFRVYMCIYMCVCLDMVNFINLFPIHLFETALFFAFICFLNDGEHFFPLIRCSLLVYAIYYYCPWTRQMPAVFITISKLLHTLSHKLLCFGQIKIHIGLFPTIWHCSSTSLKSYRNLYVKHWLLLLLLLSFLSFVRSFIRLFGVCSIARTSYACNAHVANPLWM